MIVYVGFDTYGVAGEGPRFRAAFADEEAARGGMSAGCWLRRFSGSADHDCVAERCEGVWWEIEACEVQS